MAEKKVHKKETPNPKEPTPTNKKAVDMRKSGLSLNEISEKLNISRKEVETVLAIKPKVEVKKDEAKKGK